MTTNTNTLFFTPELIANVIIQVTFIAVFIGIFFFTYGAKIEQQVVKNQMEYIVKDLADDINILVPNKLHNTLSQAIQNIQPPNMEHVDQIVADNNAALIKQALTILTITLIVGTAIVYYMSTKYNLDFKQMIKTSLIIVTFVGITEYIFLTFIGKNFQSADPNFVKLAIINGIENYLR